MQVSKAKKILEKIEDSLRPPITEKVEETPPASDLAEALLQLPVIASHLAELKEEKKREVNLLDTIAQVDFSINVLSEQTKANLKRTGEIESLLFKRLIGLDLLESKYSLMIDRVNRVLDELERVLKKI